MFLDFPHMCCKVYGPNVDSRQHTAEVFEKLAHILVCFCLLFTELVGVTKATILLRLGQFRWR
jgi:hypothetical protein